MTDRSGNSDKGDKTDGGITPFLVQMVPER